MRWKWRLIGLMIWSTLQAHAIAHAAEPSRANRPKPTTEPSLHDICLAIGESQLLRSGPNENIQIKGKKIISVTDLGPHLKVTGRASGQASVQMAHTTWAIHVVTQAQKLFYEQLLARLKERMGISLRLQDGQIVVYGELLRLADWQELATLADQFEARYIMMATVDRDVRRQAENWLTQLLHEARLPLPRLVWAPALKVTIPAEHESLNSQWQAVFGRLGIPLQYEKSELAVQPLVRVKIVVAEVNKKAQSQIGIEWPNMITAQVSPQLKGPDALNIFLKAMEQNGLGQILASPNLLARSGSEADFLAGGEFPIKIITPKLHDVTWKRHGIYLKIKPRADVTGRVSIELSTEVSLIDASQAVDGIPGLKTNRMATHFDLTTPRTIVLSGLIRQDWGHAQQGVWGLTQIPILGALFRSRDYMNNKSELVIFVTPEIVNDADETAEPPHMPQGWSSNG